MGIINVTPDSFSGDGILTGSEVQKIALDQARSFIDSGVDIIDIGESPHGLVHKSYHGVRKWIVSYRLLKL